MLFQRFSWVWLYRIRLTVTKQASNSHQILTQMLLNPDWCTEVGDIALLQVSPAYFIPVRRAQEKEKEHRNLSCEITKTGLGTKMCADAHNKKLIKIFKTLEHVCRS